MKTLEMTRRATFVLAAALAVGGCGGRPLPSPGGTLGADVASLTGDSCDIPDEWYFHGACTWHALPASGWTYELAKYRGYTIAVSISSNNGSGSAELYFSDATGKNDISGTYKGKAFSPYGPTCYYDGKKETCPGKVFLYIHLTSTNTKTINLKAAPTAKMTSESGYTGTECFPAPFMDNTEWEPNLALESKPQGETLSLTLSPPSQKQMLPPNANFVLAFACE